MWQNWYYCLWLMSYWLHQRLFFFIEMDCFFMQAHCYGICCVYRTCDPQLLSPTYFFIHLHIFVINNYTGIIALIGCDGQHLYPTHNKVVRGYIGFTPSVRPYLLHYIDSLEIMYVCWFSVFKMLLKPALIVNHLWWIGEVDTRYVLNDSKTMAVKYLGHQKKHW